MTVMLTLDIGGVIVGVVLPDEAWWATLQPRYAPFVTAAASAWRLTLAHDPSLTDTGHAWISHDGAITRFRAAAYAGWIDLAARRAAVSTPTLNRAASALDRTLAYVCMQVLPREHDALVLHAAGIVLDGGGYLFFGPSGAGKTTVAQLAIRRGQVLTDESVIVRLGVDGPELISTPFWGHSTPRGLISRVRRQVPLRGLYALVQAPVFDLVRLNPAAAAIALLGTEKVATERVPSAAAWLDVAGRLVTRLPVYQLHFRPTPRLWSFLDQHNKEVLDEPF
ncbi:MAG: hypothetical protein M5U01_39185 [Ardenticatenaceae bacterium]|nr:hypothetical protein [Ardenticatenaceae bacterium]